jgi:SET domain-containing protein
LNKYWCIDGAVGGSGAELINHSCTPNLYAWICRERILYMSVREIQPGEELTIDYHFAKDVERVACRCGSADCRGTINVLK